MPVPELVHVPEPGTLEKGVQGARVEASFHKWGIMGLIHAASGWGNGRGGGGVRAEGLFFGGDRKGGLRTVLDGGPSGETLGL